MSSLLLWAIALCLCILAAHVGGYWNKCKGSWKIVIPTVGILILLGSATGLGLWGVMLA